MFRKSSRLDDNLNMAEKIRLLFIFTTIIGSLLEFKKN